jgi:HSP20 family molecular chaperone IbpA
VEKRRNAGHGIDELEQLFADLWQVVPFAHGMRRAFRPDTDCFRTEDPPALVVLFELPGVEPDDVELVAAPHALLVAGDRRRPKNCGHYQQMEIEYGPFQRELTFAEDVDPEAASASYERGILRVTLPIAPKPAETESVSIPVRTGG